MCNYVQLAILFLLGALTIDIWMEPIGQCDRGDWFYFLNDACLLERFSLKRVLKERLALLVDGDLIYLNDELLKLSNRGREIVEQCRKITADNRANASTCVSLKYDLDVWIMSAQMFVAPYSAM